MKCSKVQNVFSHRNNANTFNAKELVDMKCSKVQNVFSHRNNANTFNAKELIDMKCSKVQNVFSHRNNANTFNAKELIDMKCCKVQNVYCLVLAYFLVDTTPTGSTLIVGVRQCQISLSTDTSTTPRRSKILYDANEWKITFLGRIFGIWCSKVLNDSTCLL